MDISKLVDKDDDKSTSSSPTTSTELESAVAISENSSETDPQKQTSSVVNQFTLSNIPPGHHHHSMTPTPDASKPVYAPISLQRSPYQNYQQNPLPIYNKSQVSNGIVGEPAAPYHYSHSHTPQNYNVQNTAVSAYPHQQHLTSPHQQYQSHVVQTYPHSSSNFPMPTAAHPTQYKQYPPPPPPPGQQYLSHQQVPHLMGTPGQGINRRDLESHKIKERRRRETINESMDRIQKLLPRGDTRSRARLLSHTAEYIQNMQAQERALRQEIDRLLSRILELESKGSGASHLSFQPQQQEPEVSNTNNKDPQSNGSVSITANAGSASDHNTPNINNDDTNN